MSATPSLNRRTFLLSTAGGIIVGAGWGATIQKLGGPSGPTLTIVGKRQAQVVLLDTTRVRVLVLMGVPDQDLRMQITPLLSTLRQRIDILAGSSEAITSLGHNFHKRWRVRHTFMFLDDENVGRSSSTETWVNTNVKIELGDGVSMEGLRSSLRAWDSAAETKHLWNVVITFGLTIVSMAPDAVSAQVLAPPGAALIIVPDADIAPLLRSLSPGCLALNSKNMDWAQESEGHSAMLIRIYPEDIARFGLRDDSIELPYWAESSIK